MKRLRKLFARQREAAFVLLGVGAWKLLLFIFTAQPVPFQDAFFHDGAVVNYLRTGEYINPALAEAFPISATRVFSAYPPLYQFVLLPWMWIFGTEAHVAVAFHLLLWMLSGLQLLVLFDLLEIPRKAAAIGMMFLFGITFQDRPEDLGQLFGLATLILLTLEFRGSIDRRWLRLGIVCCLLATLLTSPMLGAVYFATVFFGYAAEWWMTGKRLPFVVPLGVTALFLSAVLVVQIRFPVAWEGFLENGLQAPSLAGLRLVQGVEFLKAVRTVPIHLVGIFWLGWLLKRAVFEGRRPIADPGILVTQAVAGGGGALLIGTHTFLGNLYTSLPVYLQPLLVAGLLAWVARTSPKRLPAVWTAVAGCFLVVAVRAVAMAAPGIAVLRADGYWEAMRIVRSEIATVLKSDAVRHPVIVSSAFLYEASREPGLRLVYADWHAPRNAPLGLAEEFRRLAPRRLILTQFDYYRSHEPWLAYWQRTEGHRYEFIVRNTAASWVPDATGLWQRIVQNVCWAPVIVTVIPKPVSSDARMDGVRSDAPAVVDPTPEPLWQATNKEGPVRPAPFSVL